MAKGRDNRGYFVKGNKIASGRPCTPYSLTAAMRMAKQAVAEGAIDTDGTFGDPGKRLTREQCAALWLAHVAATGQDRREDRVEDVAFRDRLTAIQTIWQQCEPVKDQAKADEESQQAAQDARMVQLGDLSDDEIELLMKLKKREMAARN